MPSSAPRARISRRLTLLSALMLWAALPSAARAVNLEVFWQYAPSLSSAEAARAVATDAAGNLYVGGVTYPGGISGRAWGYLRKYSRYGVIFWTITFSGNQTAAGNTQEVRGVAMLSPASALSDIVVAGVMTNTATGQDPFAARVTPDGATVWVGVDFSSTLNGGANAVAATPGGDAVVAGFAGPAIHVERLSGATGGTVASANYIHGSVNGDSALAVAVDGAGSIYVGGFLDDGTAGQTPVVVQYPPSPGGLANWIAPLTAAGTDTAYVAGVAVDPTDGRLYAVGGVTQPVTARDILAAKVTPDGAVVWTFTADGGASGFDEARGCAGAPNGDLLLAGSITTAASTVFADVWAARWTSPGVARWTFVENGVAGKVDGAAAIALNPQSDALVAGFMTKAGLPLSPLSFVVDLRETATSSEGSGGSPVPHATPNPFRPGRGGSFDSSSITFRSIPAGAAVRVYTIAGTLVADLADSDRDGMVTWTAVASNGKAVASGIYLFIVVPESGPKTRGKLVIIR